MKWVLDLEEKIDALNDVIKLIHEGSRITANMLTNAFKEVQADNENLRKGLDDVKEELKQVTEDNQNKKERIKLLEWSLVLADKEIVQFKGSTELMRNALADVQWLTKVIGHPRSHSCQYHISVSNSILLILSLVYVHFVL